MNRNPVLNSPDDITDELIRQIIHNDLILFGKPIKSNL